MIITSDQEVMFSFPFVCLSTKLHKNSYFEANLYRKGSRNLFFYHFEILNGSRLKQSDVFTGLIFMSVCNLVQLGGGLKFQKQLKLVLSCSLKQTCTYKSLRMPLDTSCIQVG